MIAGEFNVNLLHTEGAERDEEIAADLAASGLEDMSAHFRPRRHPWCWDGRKWSMLRLGREVRS